VQSYTTEFNIKKRLLKQLAELANIAPNILIAALMFWEKVDYNFAPGMRPSNKVTKLQLLQIESPETRNVSRAVARKVKAPQRSDSSMADYHPAKASARRVFVHECCRVRK
jgi:hypothetical protein